MSTTVWGGSSWSKCQFYKPRLGLYYFQSLHLHRNNKSSTHQLQHPFLTINHCCLCTSCRTCVQRDLRVVGSEAGEVLLLAGDQSEQQDVSRGQVGQRVVRVSTLSEDGTQRHAALSVTGFIFI